jgi:acetoin utilization protein AcuC
MTPDADLPCSPAEAPVLIAGDVFRAPRHSPGHPLSISRVSLAVDLCRALGWLPDHRYREAVPAADGELMRFHEADYIAAVRRAEAEQGLSEAERRRFNLGVNGNPIHAEVFRRPATACGASLAAARMLCMGGVVYSPAGGTHHGQPGRASGYCVFNDPVLAILELQAHGLERICYLDLDAHFGDGVQQAFHHDDRVFTISVHEAGRWPMQPGDPLASGFGGARDRAGGAARNLPLPSGANDSEFTLVMAEVVIPLIRRFAPQALVVQGGADALADDPMTRLALSNGALWAALQAVMPLAPRLLLLGGGGYNPWAVGRCWAGFWATLNGLPIPDPLPEAAQALLQAVRWHHRLGREPQAHWLQTLADPPHPGPVRPECTHW